MAQIVFRKHFLVKTQRIDHFIGILDRQKLKLLLTELRLDLDGQITSLITSHHPVEISVPDRGICLQLNRYCKGFPNFKFVVDGSEPFFTLKPPKTSVDRV